MKDYLSLFFTAVVSLLLAGALFSCGGGGGGGQKSPAPIVNNSTDPTGDAVGISLPFYDVTSVTTTRTGPAGSTTYDTLTINVTFSENIQLMEAGGIISSGDLTGAIDIDTDQNVSTGGGLLDQYNLFCSVSFPPPAVGAEYEIVLSGRKISGEYPILNQSRIEVGLATPTVNGNTLTLDISLSSLGGDDGATNMGMVWGNDSGPTDCAPDSGGVLYPTYYYKIKNKSWQ